MNRTKIEWCQNPDGREGYTWNPITGCLNDCSYCWARGLANGRLKSRMLANTNLASHSSQPVVDHGGHHGDPFYPRLWKGRLRNVSYSETQRGIFVCSMGDLFGQGVPADWTGAVLEQCRRHPDDRFYLLTKQPQNLQKWAPFPDNCWVGVSATNGQQAGDAVGYLLNIKARLKYISYEPLLERIEISDQGLSAIDWVIIGAQTKPTVMPKLEWVKEIVDAADRAGIPVFMKDSLSTPSFVAMQGLTWRREFPRGV